ncbi:MAG: hypothetical protein AB1758_21210, partial [Candidatus Eremiobacterota bacterium]
AGAAQPGIYGRFFPSAPAGGPAAPAPPPDFDFSKLNAAQRTQLSGLSDQQRAAIHLWGIQVTSAGKPGGGVYYNVLQNPEKFQPAEVALVQAAFEQEWREDGGVTGRVLDQAFFGAYRDSTGIDLSARYGNRPIEFARGPVNMDNRITGNNGLGSFTNAALRLWGHDRLDNGLNDGSIVEFSLNSPTAFDADLNRGDLQALLAGDVGDNGRRDGTALEMAFVRSLDQLYLGAPPPTAREILTRSGVSQNQVPGVLERLAQNPPPGVPPGVDITNMANIHRCPVLGSSVTQQGIRFN